MEIQWSNKVSKVADLLPWSKNPRKFSPEQIDNLKKSIEKFGYTNPILVNLDGQIIAGHMRLKILKLIGTEEVDVRVPSRKLSEKECEELAIRDNTNTGDWDWGIIEEQFNLDELLDWGMDSGRIEKIRRSVREDNFDVEEQLNRNEPTITQSGDLWKLGEHKLLCGSSTEQSSYEKLLAEERADLIFTDPPYGVNYRSPQGNSYSRGQYASDQVFNDDLESDELYHFYVQVLNQLRTYSKDNCAIYWFYAGNRRTLENHKAFDETGWKISQVLIWLKENMIFSRGQDYHRCFEPIIFGWKQDGTHKTNKKIVDQRDVFSLDRTEFADLYDVWYERRDSQNQYVHPTQKPLKLAEKGMRKNSSLGDIVLDVFGGSGSTLMACEQFGRKARLIELDPKFCDVIIKRWQSFTGRVAEKL